MPRETASLAYLNTLSRSLKLEVSIGEIEVSVFCVGSQSEARRCKEQGCAKKRVGVKRERKANANGGRGKKCERETSEADVDQSSLCAAACASPVFRFCCFTGSCAHHRLRLLLR